MPATRQKPIHIFRPGKHLAMQGADIAFSEADLAACAAAYDPAKHEAPLVIGHPTANGPAYGWVHSLSASPEGLFASPRQVEPCFAEAVTEGRYKKVSASFYRPSSPHNPVPGVYYLRHVGFLGSQPPAVKGLQDVAFADDGKDCLTVEFGEEKEHTGPVARYVSALKELLHLGAADFAETPTPCKEEKPVDKKNISAPPAEGTPPASSVSADSFVNPERVDAMEKELASFREAQRRAEAQAVVSAAVNDGRLAPAHATGLVEFMASLSDEDTVSFGEGDGSTKQLSQPAFMTAFLARLPRQVDFGEASADQHLAHGLTPEEAAREALCYQEGLRQKGIVISVTDAMAAVKAGANKEAPRG